MAYISRQSGIGMRIVTNTISEYKKTGQLTSPCKNKYRPTILEKIDNFDKKSTRQKIHEFWLRREIPTLSKIVEAVIDDPSLPNIPCTSLRRVLKDLNFEYTKRS
jgi:transposase